MAKEARMREADQEQSGVARVGWTFTFAATAYNLVRMRNLNPVAT